MTPRLKLLSPTARTYWEAFLYELHLLGLRVMHRVISPILCSYEVCDNSPVTRGHHTVARNGGTDLFSSPYG